MAVGRITGPLLKANLLRNGVDLAFETDLLYLDVNNGRVGIKTSLPDYDLDIAGTTRSTNLTATTQADLATFTIDTNTIASSNGVINLRPAGANPVVYQGKIVTGDLQLSTNVIETTAANQDLNINTLGTGKVNVNADLHVNGDVHVTGNLQVDGDANGTITIGDTDTDNVEFKADVNSNIIPDDNETWDLGSDPSASGRRWKTVYTRDLIAQQVTADTIVVNGIDLAQVQGNIYYVATTGNDTTNAGEHEHDPFLTVNKALTVATAGDTIYIYPGTYTEIFPLTVPAGVTVKGAGIRSVTIQPTLATNTNDAFLLNGETTVEDLTVTGFYSAAAETASLALTLDNPNPYSTSAGDNFGYSVATSGTRTIVGAPNEDDAVGTGRGKAYVYDTATGNLLFSFSNPSSTTNDQFGYSVDIDGDKAIVGSPFDDTGAGNSGRAYVYDLTTGALLYTLTNPNPGANDYFGLSVGISGDRAIVGVPYEDITYSDSGVAYVFNLTTGLLQYTLSNPQPVASTGDFFGFSVAISGDRAIVGAYGEYNAASGSSAVYGSGKAYVYNLLTGGLLYTLNNPNGSKNRYFQNNDYFGYSVDIDGDRAIVGAYPEEALDGNEQGAAYIFDMNNGSCIAILEDPNIFPSASDNFGWKVGISGTRALVGAPSEDETGNNSSGKAYLYDLDSFNTQTFTVEYGGFGNSSTVFSLSLASLGFTGTATEVLVTQIELRGDFANTASEYIDIAVYNPNWSQYTPTRRYTGSGANSVYSPANGTGQWQNEGILFYGQTNNCYIQFIVPSAVGTSPSGMPSSYTWQVRLTLRVFTSTSITYTTIDNPNAYSTAASDNFGNDVAISGNNLVVGAYEEDDSAGLGSGKAYIYNVDVSTLSQGYAFRFANNLNVTTRSPYVRNVTVITSGSVTSAADPRGYSEGDAGRGVYLDGSVVNSASKEASMLFHSVTFITPGVDCLTMTNGVRVEWLNSFSYFAYRGLYALTGTNGFANVGKTRLRIDSRTGTWSVGNTVTYYDTDKTTVLASGTIASIDGNYINLTGYTPGFETVTDRSGKTVYAQGDAKLSTAQKKFGLSSLQLDGTGDYARLPDQPDFDFGYANRLPKTITANGGAFYSTTQSKFGGASIFLDGTGDYLSLASTTDFGWGTGDFTLEGWFFKNSATQMVLFDQRTSAASQVKVYVESNAAGNLRLFVNGSYVLTSSNAMTTSAWNHVAITRASGTTRFFINGIVSTNTYADTNDYGSTAPLTIGATWTGGTPVTGYIEEIRVSNTARYTATFTPALAAFTHDSNSLLLIHGDENILDDAGDQYQGTFALEAWVYRTISGSYTTIFDMRSSATDVALFLGISNTNTLYCFINGTIVMQGATTVPLNTWAHVSLTKQNHSLRMFLNGTQEGTTYVDKNTYPQRQVRIGADWQGLYGFTGYIDDVRVSKGVSRYVANYTVPSTALVGDLSTVLLLHFDGANNSTLFLDDGVTLQDLRTSAGGTATLINFADYSDFGAELRSIGSASIYGLYGAYGDGPGVLMYLIGQNFAYVGSGKVSTNDPNTRIAINEVVKLNRAKIYYTSVDNEGNFSVGDAFFVNQETGDVLFNGQSLNITVPAGITFTDGVNSTTITPTNIDTGNIRISGNTVESITGPINITAESGVINLQNNTYVTGNLDVTGDITLGGNIQVGDASTDTINFVGGISSNLVPSTTTTYDLGSSSLRWDNVYLSRAEIDGVVIDNNQIATTVGNDNLTLQANGTGVVSIPNNDVQIGQKLTVTGDVTVTTGTTYLKNTSITGTVTQNGDINQTGTFTTSGNTQVTGNITGTGYLQLPQIKISGNTIETIVTNTDLQLTANGTGNVKFEDLQINSNTISSLTADSNITLTPQGTGSVIISSNQSLQVPVGTNLQRPGTPANGMIRYNSDLNRYEGYNNGFWLALSGVQDADGNTYITAELTPGANDNTIRFYTDGNLMVTIDSTKLFAERLQTANLDIQNDTISSISLNSDINLTATGTGSVKFGNLAVRNNTITNTVSGAITQFAQSGTGYVKIDGTNGVVIPSGLDADRPASPVTGMIRYNTQQFLVEVYNGTIWTGVAGSSGGITASEAQDIAITYVLVLG